MKLKTNLKTDSGQAPEESPLWYSLFVKVLSDTNTNLEDAVCSDPTDTLYIQIIYHDEIAGGGCNIFDDKEEDHDKETNTTVPYKPARESKPRKKLVVKPHQKRIVVHPQTQALSQLAGSLNQLVESHAKRYKEQMNFEKERDKAFLEFKKQEAEKNPPPQHRDGEDLCCSSRIDAIGASKHAKLLLTTAI